MHLKYLFLLTTVLAQQLFRKGTPIKETKAKRFTDEVLYSPLVSFVMFYAPWCGHCQSAAPEVEKSAEALKGIVNFFTVDCTMKSNKELCANYGAKGYPHFKVIVPGKLTEKDYLKVEEGNRMPHKKPMKENYDGERTKDSIVSFLKRKVTGFFKTLKPDTIEEFVENRGPKLILLQGSKDSAVPNYFKALTYDFFGQVRFAVAPRKTQSKWSDLNLPNSANPKLVFVSDGQVKAYKGKSNKEDIAKFIKNQLESKEDL